MGPKTFPWLLLGAAVLAGLGCTSQGNVSTERAEPPRNVVLLIGDGMGFEQVRAAAFYLHGREGELAMEGLPHAAEMTTHPAGGPGKVTDSAAASTAMATGVKVGTGVISLRTPGDGMPLKTALEVFRDRGARTGLVTTTYMTHATPAAFAAHVPSRGMTGQIARQYLSRTRPNVLFGGALGAPPGAGGGMAPEAAREAGYTVVTTRDQMNALRPREGQHVSGQFGNGHMPYEYDFAQGVTDAYDTLPHLSEMTAKAIELLENPNGFFLMVESGRIDHAGHRNELERNVFETVEFDRTVEVVLEWAATGRVRTSPPRRTATRPVRDQAMGWVRGRDDTLVLVTADHECGGLRGVESRGTGTMPEAEFTSGGHTGVPVPLWAMGVGAEGVTGRMDNTDLFALMTGLEKPAPMASPPMAVTEDEEATPEKPREGPVPAAY